MILYRCQKHPEYNVLLIGWFLMFDFIIISIIVLITHTLIHIGTYTYVHLIVTLFYMKNI